MQRGRYQMPPANSPPLLHHPVPQHISQVPNLRSPPPPTSQNGYDYGGQQIPQQGPGQGGQAGDMPQFGGFMNDPTAQMGLQMGQSAMKVGQEYVEQNFNRYINVSALKHYFNVSNRYVLSKTLLVLFPWRHRPWSRSQTNTASPSHNGSTTTQFLPPREDVNSPDMYIPLMAFITYVLLTTLIAGLNGKFEPQLLGMTFSNASVVIILELLVLWLGRYFLNISSESQIYDLVAYSGYKFVGVIVTIAVAAIVNRGKGTGGWVGWTVFAYTFMANAFFLLRSLKYVLLPPDNSPSNPSMQTIARGQRSRRTQFLFVYSYVVQFAFMWWLTALNFTSGVPVVAGGKGIKGRWGR
ncbi:Protein transport protein yif1 [Friedmanniomyces endolithicus]|uniref:Protein YIF1 n=1 Tax=Friedmanniomyces endolithicus TaxID=329885 RepID=A0AAN6J6W4_9PEZI|nr:Protein transport protein yif1 [Friedmanniomyces endolithicus]KAK0309705.1 Protein transport protein yif1 [Friedmanniomyces endolithicus]KAK1007719.1 Protein transport protein yif1 [Friedmanniomyces endolithicus]